MQTLLNEALVRKPVTSFDSHSISELLDVLRGGADASIVNAVRGLGGGAIDCCGTGGSGSAKFNTSTAVAFILAAADLRVIKFGNRSASGKSGSVDFLMKCGMPDSIRVGAIKDIFDRTNVLFLNARDVYPAVGSLSEFRKKFGKPSILNYVGPLLNPARPSFRLLGVSHPIMQRVLAEQLVADNSVERAMIVRSHNNVDELEPDSSNCVLDLGSANNELENAGKEPGHAGYDFRAAGYELVYTRSERIAKDSPSSSSNVLSLVERNFRSFATILNGFDDDSRNYHSIVFNAAAGLLVAGSVSTIEEGVVNVQKLIADGVALRKFQEIRRIYRECA